MINDFDNMNMMEILKDSEKFTVQYSLERTAIADQSKQIGLTFAPVKDSKVEKVTASVGEPGKDNYFAVEAHINKVYSVDPLTKEKTESEMLQLDTINMAAAFEAFAAAMRIANAAINTMYTASMVAPEVIAHSDKLVFTGDFLASLLLNKDSGLSVSAYQSINDSVKNAIAQGMLRSIGLANENSHKFNALKEEVCFYDRIRNRVLKNGAAFATNAAKLMKEDSTGIDISSVRIQPTGAAPLIKTNAGVNPKSLNTADTTSDAKVLPIL